MGYGSLEGTVPVAQEHVIAHHQVELAVGIEVTHGLGCPAASITHQRLESAVAAAKEHAVAYQVELAVAVEVPHGDVTGAEELGVGSGKAAVTAAQQHVRVCVVD